MFSATSTPFILLVIGLCIASGIGVVAFLRRLATEQKAMQPYQGIRDVFLAGLAAARDAAAVRSEAEQQKRIEQCFTRARADLARCLNLEVLDADSAPKTAEHLAIALLAAEKQQPLRTVERRLLAIAAMVRERNAEPLMPSLNDLTELSRNYEHNRVSMCAWRIAANTVLVSGICGTMWGVSNKLAELQNAGETFSIHSLSEALVPGMYAVFFYIIMMGVMGVIEGRLERLLQRLDALTMSLFIPLFQPLSLMDKEHRRFLQILQLGHALQGVNGENLGQYMEKLQNEVQEGMHGAMSSFSAYIDRLDRSLAALMRHLGVYADDQLNVLTMSERLSALAGDIAAKLRAYQITMRDAMRDYLSFSALLNDLGNLLRRAAGDRQVTMDAVSRIDDNLKKLEKIHETCKKLAEQHLVYEKQLGTITGAFEQLASLRRAHSDAEMDLQGVLQSMLSHVQQLKRYSASGVLQDNSTAAKAAEFRIVAEEISTDADLARLQITELRSGHFNLLETQFREFREQIRNYLHSLEGIVTQGGNPDIPVYVRNATKIAAAALLAGALALGIWLWPSTAAGEKQPQATPTRHTAQQPAKKKVQKNTKPAQQKAEQTESVQTPRKSKEKKDAEKAKKPEQQKKTQKQKATAKTAAKSSQGKVNMQQEETAQAPAPSPAQTEVPEFPPPATEEAQSLIQLSPRLEEKSENEIIAVVVCGEPPLHFRNPMKELEKLRESLLPATIDDEPFPKASPFPDPSSSSLKPNSRSARNRSAARNR